MRRPSRVTLVLLALAALWLIVDRPWTVASLTEQPASGPFDANKYVDGIWPSRVLSAVESGAVPVSALRGRGAAAGGQKALGVSFDAVVLSVDTSSRVGVALLDVEPADGRAEAALQIGPVLRGTAVRDALDFVQFSAFANQIQFAGVASALNDRVLKDVLGAVDAATLTGRRVHGLGVTPAVPATDTLPAIVPVRLVVEAGP